MPLEAHSRAGTPFVTGGIEMSNYIHDIRAAVERPVGAVSRLSPLACAESVR